MNVNVESSSLKRFQSPEKAKYSSPETVWERILLAIRVAQEGSNQPVPLPLELFGEVRHELVPSLRQLPPSRCVHRPLELEQFLVQVVVRARSKITVPPRPRLDF